MSDTQDFEEAPTPEELEAYISELREAPVDGMLAQVVSMLSTFAQAKLGRSDARPLIDVLEAVSKTAADELGEVAAQVDDLVAQLQMAQVQFERRIAEGDDVQDEPDKDDKPVGGVTETNTKPQTDKLWIPGRE